MAEGDSFALVSKEEEDDEEFIDESLAERLWGLTEMFPERLRSSCSSLTSLTWKSAKFTLGFTRNAVWILTASFSILLLPVVLERDIANAREQQQMQQRQILMGPNAAIAGQPGSGMMGMMPPGMAPPPPGAMPAPPTS